MSRPKSSALIQEVLRKSLESKRDRLINKVVIGHHLSEFRRQFKSKEFTTHRSNRQSANFGREINLRTSTTLRLADEAVGVSFQTTAQIELPNRTKHYTQYLNQSIHLQNQRYREDASKQHIHPEIPLKTQLSSAKTAYDNPNVKGKLFLRTPQYPSYANQLRYSKENTTSSYNAAIAKSKATKERVEAFHKSHDEKKVDGRKRLLSSEFKESGYISRDKPVFNRVNILGNLKKEKLVRPILVEGISLRPAIVSATGGGLISKTAYEYGEVTIEANQDDSPAPARIKRRPQTSSRYQTVKCVTESHKTKVEQFLRTILERNKHDKPSSPLSKPCAKASYLNICAGRPKPEPFNESCVPFLNGSNLPKV